MGAAVSLEPRTVSALGKASTQPKQLAAARFRGRSRGLGVTSLQKVALESDREGLWGLHASRAALGSEGVCG